MSRESSSRLRAWSHFLGAHALALRAIEERFKAAKLLPMAWYDVLLELERAGGSLRVGELGERLVIEPYNTTRLLDRLIAAGLVRRSKDRRDGRATIVSLTEKGGTLRRAIWPEYQKAISEVMASLSEADAEDLVRIMKKTISQLSKKIT